MPADGEDVTSLRRSAAALLAAATLVTLAGCAPAEPDPQEYWDELSFYAGLGEDQRDDALETGELVCADLTTVGTTEGLEAATALWAGWVDEVGRDEADFLFETAVEHLCPGNDGPLDRVRDAADDVVTAAGDAGS